MIKKVLDGVALACFAAAAVLFALDYPGVRQGGVSDGMFFMVCGKTWSFFFRKMMLALALLWLGCFLTLLRNAKGFPKMALAFLAAGFFIVPGVYFKHFSFLPLQPNVANVIGGDENPATVYVAGGPFKKLLNPELLEKVRALHQERLWKKFPETRPSPKILEDDLNGENTNEK